MKKKCVKFMLIFLLLFGCAAITSAKKPPEKWMVKLANGTLLTKTDFQERILCHRLWLKTRAAKGERLRLEGALIKNVDLTNANLTKAIMNNTIFHSVSLKNALFSETELSSAKFRKTSLVGARIINAFLPNATFYYSPLNKIIFSNVSARKATIIHCDLSNSRIQRSDLTGVYCQQSNFKKALLEHSKLTAATFKNTSFVNAIFKYVDCKETIFNKCNFLHAYISMLPGKIPPIEMLATGKNISTISYSLTPLSLIELRESAKNAGTRLPERKLTYAIMRNERIRTHEPIWSAFTYLLFELPCGWGLHPGRPLIIMLCLIPFFAIPYLIALYLPGPTGIYRVWSPGRVRKDLGKDKETERLDANRSVVDNYAMYFSILSAFHIGWRDLNVGTWISRMQPNEYTLRATGWVRTVSGIQSLISVYLLALAILTYFGRPFG